MTEQARPPVYLHIGAPKSGTTYLQERLRHNQAALRADGFLYPGEHWAAHVWAALDLRNRKFKGYPDPNLVGAWNRLVSEVRDFHGPAIIDQELLSGAFPRHIERAMNDLDFADVHIVYTLRDMARTLPAAWQEWVKNRETDTYAEFLAQVHKPVDERNGTGKQFWNQYDTPLVLTNWSVRVPPENVHVITLPPPGADPRILWDRFTGVLGIDPDRYPNPAGAENSSLSAPEAAVLREVNTAIGGDKFPWLVYDRVLKHHLAPALAKRRGPAIALPAVEQEWATEWSRDAAKFIADAGFDVVGDLDELIPSAPRGGMDPDHADPEARAAAGIAGMAALVDFISNGGDQANPQRTIELEAKVDRLERLLREHRELPPIERIKRCVVELSRQVGWLQVLHRAYRKARRRPA